MISLGEEKILTKLLPQTIAFTREKRNLLHCQIHIISVLFICVSVKLSCWSTLGCDLNIFYYIYSSILSELWTLSLVTPWPRPTRLGLVKLSGDERVRSQSQWLESYHFIVIIICYMIILNIQINMYTNKTNNMKILTCLCWSHIFREYFKKLL